MNQLFARIFIVILFSSHSVFADPGSRCGTEIVDMLESRDWGAMAKSHPDLFGGMESINTKLMGKFHTEDDRMRKCPDLLPEFRNLRDAVQQATGVVHDDIHAMTLREIDVILSQPDGGANCTYKNWCMLSICAAFSVSAATEDESDLFTSSGFDAIMQNFMTLPRHYLDDGLVKAYEIFSSTAAPYELARNFEYKEFSTSNREFSDKLMSKGMCVLPYPMIRTGDKGGVLGTYALALMFVSGYCPVPVSMEGDSHELHGTQLTSVSEVIHDYLHFTLDGGNQSVVGYATRLINRYTLTFGTMSQTLLLDADTRQESRISNVIDPFCDFAAAVHAAYNTALFEMLLVAYDDMCGGKDAPITDDFARFSVGAFLTHHEKRDVIGNHYELHDLIAIFKLHARRKIGQTTEEEPEEADEERVDSQEDVVSTSASASGSAAAAAATASADLKPSKPKAKVNIQDLDSDGLLEYLETLGTNARDGTTDLSDEDIIDVLLGCEVINATMRGCFLHFRKIDDGDDTYFTDKDAASHFKDLIVASDVKRTKMYIEVTLELNDGVRLKARRPTAVMYRANFSHNTELLNHGHVPPSDHPKIPQPHKYADDESFTQAAIKCNRDQVAMLAKFIDAYCEQGVEIMTRDRENGSIQSRFDAKLKLARKRLKASLPVWYVTMFSDAMTRQFDVSPM